MARHVKTDPACRLYRQPRTRIGWWWFDRRRGVPCRYCVATAYDPRPTIDSWGARDIPAPIWFVLACCVLGPGTAVAIALGAWPR